jgi:hypothetical protein
MAEIYCPKCSALTSDRAARCPSCGRRDPGRQEATAHGRLFVSVLVGSVLTAIYGRILFLAWPRWLKIFEADEPGRHDPQGHGEEAAVLLGVGIFIFCSILTAFSLRPPMVKRPEASR